MSQKLLVTGAAGMLGQEFTTLCRLRGIPCVGLNRDNLDILDEADIARVLDEHRPDVVINCAAYTKVDMAEMEHDRAFAINATGPYRLARACKTRGVVLVHYSTDYVFSGDAATPWHPFSPTAPINYYGISKRYGEQYIEGVDGEYLIIRTSWLYGHGGENFVRTILRLADERDELRVVHDQAGVPTSTATLARTTLKLLDKGARSICHVTDRATKGISWYVFACAILDVFGKTTPVVPVTTDAFPRPAKRPSYSVLDTEATEFFIGERLPHWEVSLGEYAQRSRIIR